MPPRKIKSAPNISMDLPLSIDLGVSHKPVYDAVCQLHAAGYYLIPSGDGGNGKKPLIPHRKEYQKRKDW